MKVAFGCDHAGFALKTQLIDEARKLGYEIVDCGAMDDRPSDYPDFARAVGEALAAGKAERGVLVCGSGVGASVAANKIHGIRAGLCHDTYSAHQGVEHDDMNVLCLGSRIVGEALALRTDARISTGKVYERAAACEASGESAADRGRRLILADGFRFPRACARGFRALV